MAKRTEPRKTRVSRVSVIGGCYVCGGGDVQWGGGNAQGVAARHHDATGHPTWVETVWSILYGTSIYEPATAEQPATPPA